MIKRGYEFIRRLIDLEDREKEKKRMVISEDVHTFVGMYIAVAVAVYSEESINLVTITHV